MGNGGEGGADGEDGKKDDGEDGKEEGGGDFDNWFLVEGANVTQPFFKFWLKGTRRDVHNEVVGAS